MKSLFTFICLTLATTVLATDQNNRLFCHQVDFGPQANAACKRADNACKHNNVQPCKHWMYYNYSTDRSIRVHCVEGRCMADG